MSKLHLTKIHGTGNSFLVLDHRKALLKNPAEAAQRLCDVRFGIGADGLILVEESAKAAIRMRIFNADGSEPEMCGNGVRCFHRFVEDRRLRAEKTLEIETLAGLIKTTSLPDGRIRVDMGAPRFDEASQVDFAKAPKSAEGLHVATIDGSAYHFASMGNPHAVRFVSNYDFDLHAVGRAVETDVAHFPKKTNVEFIKVENPGELTMRVWERGCGETFACGTGACASAVVAIKKGLAPAGLVRLHLLGGDLDVEWTGEGSVFMTGGAETVFEGVTTLDF